MKVLSHLHNTDITQYMWKLKTFFLYMHWLKHRCDLCIISTHVCYVILSLKFIIALLCNGELCGSVMNTLSPCSSFLFCLVLVAVEESLLIVSSLLMLSASRASSRMSLANCWAIGDTMFSLSSSSSSSSSSSIALEATLSLSAYSSIMTSSSFTFTFELNDTRDSLGFSGDDRRSRSSQESGLFGIFRMPLLSDAGWRKAGPMNDWLAAELESEKSSSGPNIRANSLSMDDVEVLMVLTGEWCCWSCCVAGDAQACCFETVSERFGTSVITNKRCNYISDKNSISIFILLWAGATFTNDLASLPRATYTPSRAKDLESTHCALQKIQ